MNADTPLEEFFQHTRRATDASRDKVVAAAIAKKPNLETALIAALHGDANARWGARTFLASPAVQRTPALVAAVSESILLQASEINEGSSDDQKDAAAYGAVLIAETLSAHRATFRPALLRLREVTGPPVKQAGRVTGREELARWLR